jgi:hypothetical protein
VSSKKLAAQVPQAPASFSSLSRAMRAHLTARLTPQQLGLGAAQGGRIAPLQQNEVAGSASGKVEMVFADGSRVTRFRNGTEREQRPDGTSIVRFGNGDVKRSALREAAEGGGVVDSYYYSSAGTLQTTYPAGIEVFEFPSGQIELHDTLAGFKEILFVGGAVRIVPLVAGAAAAAAPVPHAF